MVGATARAHGGGIHEHGQRLMPTIARTREAFEDKCAATLAGYQGSFVGRSIFRLAHTARVEQVAILKGMQQDLTELVRPGDDDSVHGAGSQKVEGGDQGGFPGSLVFGDRDIRSLNIEFDGRTPLVG